MKHTKIFQILLVLFAAVVCFGPVGLAAPVGTAFTYQGRLIDANEAADGLYDFQFKLFDAVSDGNQLWVDVNMPEVDVIDGYFTVELDFGNIFDGNERWLLIGVRPGIQSDPNAYTVLSPRQKLTPTPYALYAKTAGISVPLSLTGSVASPAAVIDANNTSSGYGVRGKHNSSGNTGYLGISNAGVYGYSTSSGVYGYSSSGSGSNGVYGYNSSSGNGVYGYNSSSGNGVYGYNSSSGNYGYLGSSSYGVYGSSSTNYGVYGTTTGGTAVYGYNSNTGDYGALGYGIYLLESGVYGRSSSGKGVFGQSASGTGVYGGSDSGSAVFGYSYTGKGVYGWSATGIGVYGRSDTNYAGYFNGKGCFTGRLGIGVLDPCTNLDVSGAARIRNLPTGSMTAVSIDGSGYLYKASSSRRYKSNIQDLKVDTSAVLALRPVSFEYKESGQKDIGMIAEEVDEQVKDLVVYNDDGSPESVKYDRLGVYLLKIVKQQQNQLDSKEQQIENQQRQIEVLRERLSILERTISRIAPIQEGVQQ
jgi:hypothetical protein